MSNSPNQFSSAPGDGAGSELDAAAEMLRQTKPWVRLISIMLFVGAGFMVLAGGFMVLGSAVAGLGAGGGAFNNFGGGVAMGILYMGLALIYIVPARYLWQYASRTEAFDLERSSSALSSALQAQKSFWKFCGIFMVIYLVVLAVAMLVAIVGGIATNM